MTEKFLTKIRIGARQAITSFNNKNSFTFSLSYLVGGKVLIILLTILTTPIMTRLYSPEQYGYFSYLNVIALNFAAFSSLGYPFALIKVRSSGEFYNLLALSILTVILFWVLAIGIIIFFSDYIIPFSGKDFQKTDYLLLLIFSLLLFSLLFIFPRWNVWRNQFRQGASINLMVSVVSRLGSIGFGFLAYPYGIIFGELVGKLSGLMANFKLNFLNEWNDLKTSVKKDEIIKSFRKFKNYPRYVLTSNYLSGLIGQMPIFIIPFFFEPQVLGHYSFAISLLNLPILLIGAPLASMMQKKVADLKMIDEFHVATFVKRVFNGLLFFGVVPYMIIGVWASDIFALFFGSEWTLSGRFSEVLVFYGIFELIQSSLQNILLVYDRERILFNLSVFRIALTLVLFLPGILMNNIFLAILGLTIARSVGSLVVINSLLKICNLKSFFLISKLCLIPLVFFVVFKGLDFLFQ